MMVLAHALTSQSVLADCPPPEFSGSGFATFYNPASESNACNLPFEDDSVVAVPESLWDGSAHCGECLEVSGPLGTVVVQVVDKCPECATTQLDLSASAFAQVGNPLDGTIDVSWQRVECPVSGLAQFRFISSNAFFFEIQARNIRHGVTAMAYHSGESFIDMPRQTYNRFQGTPGGSGIENVTIRATATTGEFMDAPLGNPSQTEWIDGPTQFRTCINELFDDGFEDP